MGSNTVVRSPWMRTTPREPRSHTLSVWSRQHASTLIRLSRIFSDGQGPELGRAAGVRPAASPICFIARWWHVDSMPDRGTVSDRSTLVERAVNCCGFRCASGRRHASTGFSKAALTKRQFTILDGWADDFDNAEQSATVARAPLAETLFPVHILGSRSSTARRSVADSGAPPSLDGELNHFFGFDQCGLLASGSGDTGPGRPTGTCADRGAFAASSESANDGSGRRPASDLHRIALSVALAL